MTTRTLRNTALAALALLVAAIALRLVGGADDDGAARALERVPAKVDAQRAADPGSLAAAETANARTVLVESEAGASEPAVGPSRAELRVTVVGAEAGPSSGPVEGAVVELLVEEVMVASAKTDAEGVCTLPNDPDAENVVVRAEAEGRYAAHREVSPAERSVRLVLPGTAQLGFTVVDADALYPVKGADVALWTDEVELAAVIGRTGPLGRVGPFDVPAESRCFLQVRCDGYLFSGEAHLPPPAGESREHRIELAPATELRARVFDCVTGEPIRAAGVKSHWGHTRALVRKSAETDLEGVAVLRDCIPRDAASGPRSMLVVEAFGYCSVQLPVDRAALGEDLSIDVPLVRSNAVTVRATSSGGMPLEDRRLRVVYRTVAGPHGPLPIESDAYDWPNGHLWHGVARPLEFPLALGHGGVAAIRDLPPGFVGLEIRTDDEERRLLAEVDGFSSVQEEREVYVSLD